MIDGIHSRERVILLPLGIDAQGDTHILEHLPEDVHASVKRALKVAWSASDADLARKPLGRLASSLQAKRPGAAARLREGLDEKLTVQALGITAAVSRTRRTANPIENLNGSVAHYCRNVKHWGDAPSVLRWVAGALSIAAARVHKLRGRAQMRTLLKALDTRRPVNDNGTVLKGA